MGMSCRQRRSPPNSRASAIRSGAAGNRVGQHAAPAACSAIRTSSTAAAVSARKRRCISPRAACASPAQTPGRGTRRSATRRNGSAQTGDTSLIWEGHKSGRHIGFCHLEKLANLDQLPPHGFPRQLLSLQDTGCFCRVDAGGGDNRSKARPSFLKKRSKKLLQVCASRRWQARSSKGPKSFLVLFFKKEHAFFCKASKDEIRLPQERQQGRLNWRSSLATCHVSPSQKASPGTHAGTARSLG